MIAAQTQFKPTPKKVEAAVKKAAFNSFRHAAAAISKDMKASLVRVSGDTPSQPGEPPHTHKGVFLRRAIRWDATREDAVIGPMYSIVGDVGAVHEFGEEREGSQYPARPFAFPALERQSPRFASEWSGSIGE